MRMGTVRTDPSSMGRCAFGKGGVNATVGQTTEVPMATYCICYGLHAQGKDHAPLEKAILGFREVHHLEESVWVVTTDASLKQVYDKLRALIDVTDTLIVFTVKDFMGWGKTGLISKSV